MLHGKNFLIVLQYFMRWVIGQFLKLWKQLNLVVHISEEYGSSKVKNKGSIPLKMEQPGNPLICIKHILRVF